MLGCYFCDFRGNCYWLVVLVEWVLFIGILIGFIGWCYFKEVFVIVFVDNKIIVDIFRLLFWLVYIYFV